ncbi:uncharacterized protein LOC135844470 [Planococcus citri]|uniref:uncharacterized protein LOC135844470 n=1 Tax=Planococcus citri TaxID=170843 RepID=UPI0031FA0B6D
MSCWSSIMSVFLTILASIMGNLYLIRDGGVVGLLSEAVNIISAYIIGSYWFMNYMYSRSCAMTIISLIQKTLEEGTDWSRLNNINNLWILLCDLVEEFNVLHGSIFLIYIGGVVVSTILFAYISMNYSKFSDAWSKGTTINSTMVCGLMILVICEMGYSVYKQVNINHRHTLLEYNTIHMNVDMLQSVTLFLTTTSVVDPKIHLNGFFALDRAVFPTILAISINLLIILRQFNATESRTHEF